MIPIHDPELEKTLKQKKFSYEEIYLMVEHIHKKSKRTKYITLLLAGLWTPAITMLCWVNYQHPISLLAGAVSSTFAIYVLDETYEALYNYIIGKMKQNDRTED